MEQRARLAKSEKTSKTSITLSQSNSTSTSINAEYTVHAMVPKLSVHFFFQAKFHTSYDILSTFTFALSSHL